MDHHTSTTATAVQALSTKEVLKRTTFSRATLWRYVKAGHFPPPHKAKGGHRVFWLEPEVNDYLLSK